MYRGTWPIRKRLPLGPLGLLCLGLYGGPRGGGAFSYERGTPVLIYFVGGKRLAWSRLAEFRFVTPRISPFLECPFLFLFVHGARFKGRTQSGDRDL